MICLFVLTKFTNVTDRHTHRQTPHDNIGRACIVSRGKNCSLDSRVCGKVTKEVPLRRGRPVLTFIQHKDGVRHIDDQTSSPP